MEGGVVRQDLFSARMTAHANSAGYSSLGVDTQEVRQLVAGLVPGRACSSHFRFRPDASTIALIVLRKAPHASSN